MDVYLIKTLSNKSFIVGAHSIIEAINTVTNNYVEPIKESKYLPCTYFYNTDDSAQIISNL